MRAPRVLLYDDGANEALVAALRDAGFEVREAPSSVALEALAGEEHDACIAAVEHVCAEAHARFRARHPAPAPLWIALLDRDERVAPGSHRIFCVAALRSDPQGVVVAVRAVAGARARRLELSKDHPK